MALTGARRKLALTMHVTASVGWLGAVVVFACLSVAGMASGDDELARAASLAMEAIGVLVLVPFSVLSLLTGLVLGLGTKWGLMRHYWVVAKLLINVAASIVLVLYTQTLAALAEAGGALRSPSPALHAFAGLALLAAAVVLSIYKPPGLTRYGWRRRAP